MGPERADLGSERADLGPERGLGGGRTYVRTDVRNGSPLCPTGHRPFGAAAQKGEEEEEEEKNSRKSVRWSAVPDALLGMIAEEVV